ncbi:MAG TPA: c-type cytochrome [Paucimonas sp.]|nr:c-type cytochrome [Paucimonas sp.]
MRAAWWPFCLLCAATGCADAPGVMQGLPAGASIERGREAIRRHGCVACHAIPGIAGPASNVGPPLAQVARRAYIGGVVPNVPADMIRWLRDPPGVDPRTAMPDMGISEPEAADIAAYLYTLD